MTVRQRNLTIKLVTIRRGLSPNWFFPREVGLAGSFSQWPRVVWIQVFPNRRYTGSCVQTIEDNNKKYPLVGVDKDHDKISLNFNIREIGRLLALNKWKHETRWNACEKNLEIDLLFFEKDRPWSIYSFIHRAKDAAIKALSMHVMMRCKRVKAHWSIGDGRQCIDWTRISFWLIWF